MKKRLRPLSSPLKGENVSAAGRSPRGGGTELNSPQIWGAGGGFLRKSYGCNREGLEAEGEKVTKEVL